MFNVLSNWDWVGLNILRTRHLLFENGQIWNIDTLITKAVLMNTATDFKKTNSFDFLNTTVNKHTAWLSYSLLSAITRNGKQGFFQWMETVVLVKEKKRWKINVLHSTPITRS